MVKTDKKVSAYVFLNTEMGKEFDVLEEVKKVII